jgi:long-chain acyl-CoA synthetase
LEQVLRSPQRSYFSWYQVEAPAPAGLDSDDSHDSHHAEPSRRSADIMTLTHLRPLTDHELTGDALADETVRLDFERFRSAVRATAGLLAEHGVGRGDVVAVVLPNRVELVVTMYAAWLLGAALTPVNPALTEDEVSYQLSDGDARVAVVDAASRSLVKNVPVLDVDSLLAASEGQPARELATGPEPDDLALLIYTSGTTGRPKGVRLDHANVSAMTTALQRAMRFTDDDRSLLILPLFHVNAIMLSVVAPLSVGGSAVILPRFNAKTFWASVEKERPTYFSAVPAIYVFLGALPAEVEPDLASLRFVLCGAAPMPPAAIVDFESRYGVPLVEGYGLSESTVALTVNPIEGPRKSGTVGKPLPDLEVAIMNEDGDLLAPGLDGEIVARGATIMRGYLGKPTETAAALKNGWLHTGDVGHFDEDGYLVLVDRKKELIIRGGENISPSEVEAVFAAHPSVLEVAVVGRPDPVMGEEPVAFVVAASGYEIDADELLDSARTVLAKFKVPKEVRVVASLPRNAIGKVVKAPLREILTTAESSSP